MDLEHPGDEVKVFISAGETSGDLHAASVVRELRAMEPGIQVTALGGSHLRRAGADLLVDNAELALIGLVQVFPKLRSFHRAWLTITRHLDEVRPDLVCLVDFPDFNFLVGRYARKKGFKVFYYISPQVWAWRPGRVDTMRRFVDDMAVILPFEPKFFQDHGMRVHFVGHPIMDQLSGMISRDQARKSFSLAADDPSIRRKAPWVALVPGSRRGEVRRFLPLLLDTAKILCARIPDPSYVVPVAPHLSMDMVRSYLEGYNLPLRLVQGETARVLRAADLVIAVSGTVTLETAVCGTPLIIVYKVSRLEYTAGRFLIHVDHIGLPNLIAGKRICPELIQDEASPLRIAREAQELLQDPTRWETQRQELTRVVQSLGGPGAAKRTAQRIVRLVRR